MTEETTLAQTDPGAFPTQGKLLALDVGLARIGLAVCDPLWLRARPHSTLTRTSRRQDFAQLATIVKAEEVQGVVCGLPLNMDGSAGPQAQTTRKWAMRLAQALRYLLGAPVPIAFWDERLSSYSARELAQQWPRQGEDALAATVILDSFLAAQKQGQPISDVICLSSRTESQAGEAALMGTEDEH
jgi:putative Holliday junction resolvase